MADHNEKGKMGEMLAVRYLEEHGYEIVETNWRFGHLEVDIIALRDNKLAFVEVKTRNNTNYGQPEDFVDKRKQRAYVKLANNYIITNNRSEEARFDIIAIIADGAHTSINHIPNAFTVIDALYK